MSATVRLTELSPNDKKFIEKKDEAEYLGGLLKSNGYKELGEKFRHCGDFLEFKATPEGDLKLINANFCKSALCPICSWRRARQWRRRLSEGVTRIDKNQRWLFLTLTIKNRPLTDLHNSLNQLNSGWQELKQNFLNDFLTGYIRVIEITRALPNLPQSPEVCHPHIHSLLLINPKYFSDYYLSHHQWRAAWKESIASDYLPIVNIKAVKEINPRVVNEVAKYTLKPGSFLGEYKKNKRGEIVGINWPETEHITADRQKADFFSELYAQIYHRRLIATGGAVRENLRGSEDDLIGASTSTGGKETGWTAQFKWRKDDQERHPNYYLL